MTSSLSYDLFEPLDEAARLRIFGVWRLDRVEVRTLFCGACGMRVRSLGSQNRVLVSWQCVAFAFCIRGLLSRIVWIPCVVLADGSCCGEHPAH